MDDDFVNFIGEGFCFFFWFLDGTFKEWMTGWIDAVERGLADFERVMALATPGMSLSDLDEAVGEEAHVWTYAEGGVRRTAARYSQIPIRLHLREGHIVEEIEPTWCTY